MYKRLPQKQLINFKFVDRRYFFVTVGEWYYHFMETTIHYCNSKSKLTIQQTSDVRMSSQTFINCLHLSTLYAYFL
jgi:hypothetical protein